MDSNDNEFEKSGSWLISFLLGALLGAGAALLLAPKAGQQTREQIKGMAKDAKGKAEGYYDQVKGKITTAMHKGKETAEEGAAENM
ncbi:MAG TPA: YtxH domain-containing protein [Deltaproteobacteria bacterium]|nr:YtxH domain-containing protein [Deltaproteobacteria bacterium]